MNRYKLAIFDLDGTLLNSLDDLFNATNYTLKQLSCPTRSLEEVRQFVGNGIKKLLERALPSNYSEEQVLQAMDTIFLPYYRAHCADCTKPYDGILDLLKRLKENGYVVMVLSNKADAAVQQLCAQYFPNLLDACYGEREGVPKKPAPDAICNILKEWNITKEDAVFIGDSEVDVITSKNAGLDLIAVDWGFRSAQTLKDTGATRIASTPKQLLKMLILSNR